MPIAGKTFDQALGETGQQSTLDNLRSSSKYDAAKAAYDSGGDLGKYGINLSGYGGGSSGGGGGDFAGNFQQTLQLAQNALKPAADTLQSSIAPTEQAFSNLSSTVAAGKQSLTDRYKSLLDQIKGTTTNQVNRQTTITNNELGKRGILGSSTLAQQEIANAVSPIETQGSQLAAQTTAEQGQAENSIDQLLAQITGQSVGAVSAIKNAIAQLQSGAVPSAISSALSQLGLTQSANQANASLAQQAQQFAQQQSLAQQQLQQNQPLINAQVKSYNTKTSATPSYSLIDLFNSL